jgi:hypothetical protein
VPDLATYANKQKPALKLVFISDNPTHTNG